MQQEDSMLSGANTAKHASDCAKRRQLWRESALLSSGSTFVISSLIFTVLLLYYALKWKTLQGFASAIDYSGIFFCDFEQHYLTTALALFRDGIPDNKYLYSCFFALVLSPLRFLSMENAFRVWGVFQIVGIFLLFWVPAGVLLRKSRFEYYLHLVLVACCIPLLHNLVWGQISVFVTLTAMGSAFLHQRKHPVWAGILLALGVSIKYYVAIYGIYFLLKKDWRAVIALACATMFFLILVPYGVLGAKRVQTFDQSVRQNLAHVRQGTAADPNSQYIANVFLRIVPHSLRRIDNWLLLRCVGYLLLGLSILLSYALVRWKVEDESLWVFLVLFTSLPFVIETSWPHYFVYLPFAQVWAWRGLRSFGINASASWTRWSFLVPSMILSSSLFFILLNNRQFYSYYGFLFFANLLVVLSVYVQVVSILLQSDEELQPDVS